MKVRDCQIRFFHITRCIKNLAHLGLCMIDTLYSKIKSRELSHTFVFDHKMVPVPQACVGMELHMAHTLINACHFGS